MRFPRCKYIYWDKASRDNPANDDSQDRDMWNAVSKGIRSGFRADETEAKRRWYGVSVRAGDISLMLLQNSWLFSTSLENGMQMMKMARGCSQLSASLLAQVRPRYRKKRKVAPKKVRRSAQASLRC